MLPRTRLKLSCLGMNKLILATLKGIVTVPTLQNVIKTLGNSPRYKRLMPRQFNRRAFRRAVWTSLARLVGVGFGAGAGSLIYKLIGGGVSGWSVAMVMVVVSFVLMTFAEYEKELEP